MYRDTGADKVAYISWMYEHRDERVLRSYFEESIEIPFEDKALPLLKERESVCRTLYGKDYMTPVRDPRHDNVKEQVEILRAYFNEQGLPLPDHYEMRFER